MISFTQLKRSAVHHPSLIEGAISKVRISNSGWLRDKEHEVVARVSRRAAHFTGLAMESAEDLQVAVYGLAGHYETHFDFSRVRAHSLTSLTSYFKLHQMNGDQLHFEFFYI